jgi:K+-transporting ATPase A subunit
MIHNKKAAIEMSIGTIVTIVLMVTMLILGIILIRNIFSSAKGVVDMTNEQLRGEVEKLFSEENAIAIYPGTRYVEIKQASTDGVGFGIKNLQQGAAGETKFSYVVSASDVANCGVSEQVAESWIVVGKAEADIAIPIGGSIVRKIMFQIPTGSPLCIARFKVEVKAGESAYASDFFDVKVLAK